MEFLVGFQFLEEKAMPDRTNNQIVVLGSDHNGVQLKQKAKDLLKSQGYRCIDLGPYNNLQSVDYVDYANQLGEIIKGGDAEWGVLVCGTGIGMSIAVNKIDNIRGALAHNLKSAQKSREHNDANVLCLGAWINDDDINLEIMTTWFGEGFGEYRHVKRVEKMISSPKGTVVFTNGIFDILHTGHIELLRFSKSLGDYLVVGINSDKSTKTLKGEDRPINNEVNRKAILESIQYVDEVIVFDDLKPNDLILTLKPDIVVKGGEWTASEVRQRDEIPEGIRVKIFPLVSNFSSSNIIAHIRGEQ